MKKALPLIVILLWSCMLAAQDMRKSPRNAASVENLFLKHHELQKNSSFPESHPELVPDLEVSPGGLPGSHINDRLRPASYKSNTSFLTRKPNEFPKERMVSMHFGKTDHYNKLGKYLKFQPAEDKEILSVSGNAQKLDSVICEWWDESERNWELRNSELRAFNDSGYVTDYELMNWSVELEQMIGNYKYHYVFNDLSQLLNGTYYAWDTLKADWIYDFKFSCSYNEYGQEVTETDSTWDAISETWLPEYMYTFNYDEYGFYSGYLEIKWDNDLAGWINSYKAGYVHDENGNLIESVYYYWDSYYSDWQGSGRYEYEYDNNNKRTDYYYYTWNQELYD